MPVAKEWLFNFGLFFVVFGMLVIVGAGNAVNLTDGLDGLAIVPVMIAAGAFGFIVYLFREARSMRIICRSTICQARVNWLSCLAQ